MSPYRQVRDVVIVAAALTAAFAPGAPGLTERWFSTGLYPRLQRVLTAFSDRLPFALFDLVILSAAAATVVVLWRGIAAGRRTRRIMPALHGLRRVAVGGAAAYLLFLVLWGFNYRRLPMMDRLVVEEGAARTDEVVELGMESVARLNALYQPAHEAGWRAAPWENAALRQAFAGVQHELSDAPAATLGRLKPTLLGPYLRWASIDGMINPFGLEVLGNPDLLSFERPFVTAHEWAHLAGYADEAEASFVGWLACVRADAGSQYSGWLAVYWQIASELGGDDRARVAESLGQGPRNDLDAILMRVRRGQWPWLQQAGWEAYDRYLKANRVEEGVASYGAVVTLILRARFEPGWVPVRRRES
jgi:hypothetical protein